MISRMTNPSEPSGTTGVRHRRPRAGERTRGAVDALQTKIAVGMQNLDIGSYLEQLQANVNELPEATGAEIAFVALIDRDGEKIETVLSATSGFARSSLEQLSGEKLEDWRYVPLRGLDSLTGSSDAMPLR